MPGENDNWNGSRIARIPLSSRYILELSSISPLWILNSLMFHGW